ncbi:putative short-chain dehydrogenase/reductase family protein [Plectosphaerella cucumerina]|uniref:Short-chain dehydrogenase/reductase family protein n=1 Tax=Plectosphaerella cucumerina TaxID=40658 RepID=A0A8K0TNH8_9PEZI|nr:putative short-chain dehydrogenase/reductase family protein [Plectosphaerella cucumerina]
MSQPLELPIVLSEEACAGRTYIVTGANTGLGYEAAKHLVAFNSTKVIIAVRNVKSGEEAKARIEESTGKTGIAEVWELDLASYASTKAFAKRALGLERIDALIENAGVGIGRESVSEGHLTTFTVNIYSTFLLAVLLLPKMSEDAKRLGIQPHIAIVTSTMGFQFEQGWTAIKDTPNPIAAVASNETFDSITLYTASKLFEMLALRHLAPLIPFSRTGVVVNLICPGLCKTDLGRHGPQEFKDNLKQMHESWGRTAEQGSRTLLFGAVAGPDSHGKLTADGEIRDESFTPSWIAGDETKDGRKKVWDDVAAQLEIAEPGCLAKIL